MVRFVLDISFVINYVEEFYSDDNNSKILDIALNAFTSGKPMLVVSIGIIEQVKKLYPERNLVLDSLFNLCEQSNVGMSDKIETLIKICALSEIEDKETYVIGDDNFITHAINKTTHKAINTKQAKEILGLTD